MKQNKGIGAILIAIILFIVMGLIGKFFIQNGDELGYVILFLYILFPLTCIISGYFVGGYLDKMKFLYPFITSLAFFLVTSFVFNFDLNSTLLFLAFIPTVLGVLLGYKVLAKARH